MTQAVPALGELTRQGVRGFLVPYGYEDGLVFPGDRLRSCFPFSHLLTRGWASQMVVLKIQAQLVLGSA